jgi:hypothetical protein
VLGWALTALHVFGRSSAIRVAIPAMPGYERSAWFTIRQGIRGLPVPDERGIAVDYMICEPSSHYFRIITGSTRTGHLYRAADLAACGGALTFLLVKAG